MGDVGIVLMLIVRLYDGGGLADRDRGVAVETASQILMASNIPTTWPPCAVVCRGPLGAGELVVRIVRGETAADARGDLPLGYSLVDRHRRAGALATIYLDRVEWISAHAGVDPGLVLGRAIAHEIGHLLLGTPEHATEGLMRPLWSRAMLQRDAPADWHFTPLEIMALHEALAARLPTTPRADRSIAVGHHLERPRR